MKPETREELKKKTEMLTEELNKLLKECKSLLGKIEKVEEKKGG